MTVQEAVFEERAVERLLLFSDAVAAIAITLLALELPVPAGHSFTALRHSVSDDAGHYLAFVISFVVISASWRQHHGALKYLERSDSRLVTFNFVWLFVLVLNPFATRLLVSTHHDTLEAHAVRFGFYAVIWLIATGTLAAMVIHVERAKLLAEGAPSRLSDEGVRAIAIVMAAFALSIPLFFVVTWAWVLWIAGPVVAGRLTRTAD